MSASPNAQTEAPVATTPATTDSAGTPPATIIPVATPSATTAPATTTAVATRHFTDLTVKDWSEKYWAVGKIGFHKPNVHELLEKHVDKLLDGKTRLKILVPLCGKSVDMKWLSDLGHTVVGVEGVDQAVQEFFSEQSVEYTRKPLTDVEGEVYRSKDDRIRIYRCDMFHFNNSLEDNFDAVWDRGSLVVINPNDRARFADTIMRLVSDKCRILVVAFHFDDTVMSAPPHVITQEVVESMFGSMFAVETADRQSVMSDRWRRQGLAEMDEVVFYLKHK